MSSTQQRVLVLTHDTLGPKMAGPAIRALEIARALNRTTQVKLISVTSSELVNQDFPVAFVTEEELRIEVDNHDILVFQGFTLFSYPWIAEKEIVLVADLYDPIHFEILTQDEGLSESDRAARQHRTTEALDLQIERADFFICASEKQRDLWMGHLAAHCRINHFTYKADPSLRSLIDVVPFGIQDEEPSSRRSAIRGDHPNISADDKILIWGGGIYNWFDPLTLIRAVAQLVPKHPDLKLFFLGLQHPNPHVPAMSMVSDSQSLATELELNDTHVFFNQDWVAYENRADYLLDADLGVSTHFNHVETAFSFRTRILDYIWAGLPIVATEGDSFADIINDSLGVVVPEEDVNALSAAIEKAIYSDQAPRYRSNVRQIRKQMRWAQTLAPLIAFCQAPHHAADYPALMRSSRNLELNQLRELVDVLTVIRDQQEAEILSLQAPPPPVTDKTTLARIGGRLKRLRKKHHI